MYFLKCEVLNCVDRPVHIVLDPLVQLDEVLAGDHVVGVEIQNVIEKVFELVLLEVGQQILTGKLKWNSYNGLTFPLTVGCFSVTSSL